MRIFVITALLTLTLNPAISVAQEEEINRRAPIIVQPKLTESGREKVNTGLFSGLGRFFSPKKETTDNTTNYIGNSGFKPRAGETSEEKAARYLAERKERLKQRTQAADPVDVEAMYRLTLPSSYNKLTHYKGKDGHIYPRKTPIDKDILAKVKKAAEKYAAQKGVPLEELATDPRFNQQLEQLYIKTAKAEKIAAAQAAKEAAARKAALAKQRAEQAKKQALEDKRRQREEERAIRESGSIVDQVTQ